MRNFFNLLFKKTSVAPFVSFIFVSCCPQLDAPLLAIRPKNVPIGRAFEISAEGPEGVAVIWTTPDGSVQENGWHFDRGGSQADFGIYKAQFRSKKRPKCLSPVSELTIQPDTQPILSEATISFTTPISSEEDDGKDHDTRIHIGFFSPSKKILGSGSVVGACCAPSDKFFPDGKVRGPFDIKIDTSFYQEPIHKADLLAGEFSVSLTASCFIATLCHDTWYFIPSITLKFSDGSAFTYLNYPKTKASENTSPSFELK